MSKFKPINVDARACLQCEYSQKTVVSGGFKFLGCYHKPHNGKWVAELEACPKEEGESGAKSR